MASARSSAKSHPVARRIRPLIRRLHAYTPGEQPKIPGLIKLNTNENPYPPSPKVLRAVRSATDGRLRLYPSPTADGLRQKLASFHGCRAENIIVGNGSDELLAMAVRCFVEPLEGKPSGRASSQSILQYFSPSYSLYPVLGDIHGCAKNAVPLRPDFGLPTVPELRRGKAWRFDAALTVVTTPNAPSGRGYATAALDDLCRVMRGLVVLDEAYVDFADEHAMALALKHPHVLVARTFSKAYSLCFQRVGYLVGHPELIEALQRIRDSYNVNGLGQVAAEATLDDLRYYHRNFARVRKTREALAKALQERGFRVHPSQTNFLLVEPPDLKAEQWHIQLRERKLLVRWFSAAGVDHYLRISIGTDADAKKLISAVAAIQKSAQGKPSVPLRTADR